MNQSDETQSTEVSRDKAIYINGGAGRVLASIPALEKHFKSNPNSIIVCEGTDEFFKNHPILYRRTFHPNHKNLFDDYIKDKDILSPEPYRRWEYYNQKCNISQGFDLEINGSMSTNMVDYKTNIHLTSSEILKGQVVINQLKEASGKDSFIVLQPFGSGIKVNSQIIMDDSGRSIGYNDMVKLIKTLSENFGVIIMSDIDITLPDNIKVGRPQASLREWVAIIKASHHFIGCDSVGQHIAFGLDIPCTVITGGTFPENVSYPNTKNMNIIDLGKDKRRYSTIRIASSEEADMSNDGLMDFTEGVLEKIVATVKKPTVTGEVLPKMCTNEDSDCGCGGN